ncbi:hypothetical protein MED297_17433 [Reinekea sp. MED297]|uniref:Uncharacterized protein n=1 Tax=Reinekea blandensis MED297 TaxID=314283 RepID=A4BFQ2_9GAMM|nr:hypothetical protein MED297_17433 [Reinekea sp. MED297] [Reinekea blandensis MED297]
MKMIIIFSFFDEIVVQGDATKSMLTS